MFPEEQVGAVRRGMLDRLKGNFADAPLICALGWIAANPNESEENLSLISSIALTHIEGENSKANIIPKIIEGEEVFSFSGELEIDTELIPASIHAAQCVAMSVATPEKLRSEIIDRLLEQWKKCATFKMQWSPGNVSELTNLLGSIGASDIISHRQRVAIAHTLSMKITDITVMKAISGIILKDTRTPQLDKLATTICLRLLRNIEQNRELTFEDRETYLKIICTLLMRGRFEERANRNNMLINRAIDEIFIGLRLAVPDMLKAVIEIRDGANLSQDIRQRISEQLREFTTLARPR